MHAIQKESNYKRLYASSILLSGGADAPLLPDWSHLPSWRTPSLASDTSSRTTTTKMHSSGGPVSFKLSSMHSQSLDGPRQSGYIARRCELANCSNILTTGIICGRINRSRQQRGDKLTNDSSCFAKDWSRRCRLLKWRRSCGCELFRRELLG